MARGRLYSVHEFGMEEEFLAYLRAKEKHGEDTDEFRKEMAEALADVLGDWSLEDYLNDMIDEHITITQDLASENTADDTIEHISGEAQWLEDMKDWQDEFAAVLKKHGGEVFRFADGVIFRMNQEAVENWFKDQFEDFKKLATSITLHEFAESSWDLRNAISGVWDDAMLLNGVFYTLDDGIRRLWRDQWYIASNAMLMHD